MKSKKEKFWNYYQPNDKDTTNDFGDCTIRALSKALDLSWVDTFKLCFNYALEEQCPISCMPLKLYKQIFGKMGFKYYGVSNKKGTKRPTVESFTKEHPTGTYILSLAKHFVCVKDGLFWDTWDCGDSCLYGYYEKVGDINER